MPQELSINILTWANDEGVGVDAAVADFIHAQLTNC